MERAPPTTCLSLMRRERFPVARTGLSLVELLLAVAILGIVTAGLSLALNRAASANRSDMDAQDLLSQGCYALGRIALFVRETSEIKVPAGHKLDLAERVLDTFDNVTHAVLPDGDGMPDADNDANGLVDDDDDDPDERIKFEEDDGQIVEIPPDYGTAAPGDYLSPIPICDRVEDLLFKKLAADLLEIKLVLNDGLNRIELFTRVKARIVVP